MSGLFGWLRGAKAPDAPKAAPPPALVRGGVPAECVELSEAFEGFMPEPYRCQAGIWTIGIGSTTDLKGKAVSASTPMVTRSQAEQMAARDLDRAAKLMAVDFPNGLPPRWWAAGVLMCNNMGRMGSWGPTLKAILLSGNWTEAARQMRVYRNADGKPSLGLRRRRWAEAAFAMGLDPAKAKARAWAEIQHVDDWPALPN